MVSPVKKSAGRGKKSMKKGGAKAGGKLPASSPSSQLKSPPSVASNEQTKKSGNEMLVSPDHNPTVSMSFVWIDLISSFTHINENGG